MENTDLRTLQRDVNLIKKAIIEIKANMSDVEMVKAIMLCHRPGPDPEGELSEWAKKQLEEARKIPDYQNISLEEAKQRILER